MFARILERIPIATSRATRLGQRAAAYRQNAFGPPLPGALLTRAGGVSDPGMYDEAASIVLARHFGDFVKAARDLGVARADLRRLTWHNPRILNAAHERIELFRIGVRSKIIGAVYSRSAKRRRWGFDAMFDSYEFRDHPFASARWAAPAQRERAKKVVDARLVLEREAAAELAIEREREAAAEQGTGSVRRSGAG